MTMKRALTGILMIAIALSEAAAEHRAIAVAPPDDSLTITFIEGDSNQGSMIPAGNDAWLDLKSVKRMGASNEKSIRTRHRFGVRVVRAGGAGGSAVITALLDSYDGRATYRLDGKPLTSAPLIVDAHAAVGTVVFHTLDIDVPVSIAEGPLAASITWQVTTD